MTKQYEPCEHRPEIIVGGALVDGFSTPCPTCEELSAHPTTNDRALLQHKAIEAIAKQRGVSPDAVIDAMENGNLVVRNEVNALVTQEMARRYRTDLDEPQEPEAEPLSFIEWVAVAVIVVVFVLALANFLAGGLLVAWRFA